jgi:hypothetical protein
MNPSFLLALAPGHPSAAFFRLLEAPSYPLDLSTFLLLIPVRQIDFSPYGEPLTGKLYHPAQKPSSPGIPGTREN